MNAASQVPPGERPGAGGGDPGASDPIAAVEAALVAMRRDQGRRRLQRRGEHGGHHHGHAPHDHHGLHDRDVPAPQRRGRGGPGLAQAARFRLLDALEAAPQPPSVSELAEAIGVDQPRASRLVQAAVEAGHARREVDPSDARRSAIVLTAAGRRVLEGARDTRRGAVESALAGFTPEEAADFARLLTRFVAAWPRDADR
ncbi:MarR family winged helix-turn-helix transcriptional regulator [Agromyces endophyticus]|uniref:MarR family winged helix-turn-helix transcriptional regulator n=1 Tax=Agromyces sp. H17E-10 TaxID=2932244 RepID=UPI001FD1B9E1|nr:MarR family winged helix-turn-helix transcriptional regulator [Agromyces sp. H17E-10]UOQ87595.1 MarR family winged helix-turn-helix transcriptional regulator [Agromyces sp. H17E-10]